MEKLHSIFPLSARPRRPVATCSCPSYLQSGKAARCDAGSSSPRCGFGVLSPTHPWAPLPVCAGRARSWQSPTSHTAQLLATGRACQDRQAGQAQAVPGSAPRISHIYPAPIPTPCTTCIHSTPHIACNHLNLPSTHDSTLTLLPSLQPPLFTLHPSLLSPLPHPCITCVLPACAHSRLPSIGAAGASVRQPTCHPCYSLCWPYTLLPSTPTCPPCFAAALSLHPAVEGSHAEHHPVLP